MVWFDPDLSVLRFHLNNTSPTARLTARCYCARRKDKSEFLSNFVSTKIKTIKPIILDQLCLPTPMAHQCFAPKCWPDWCQPIETRGAVPGLNTGLDFRSSNLFYGECFTKTFPIFNILNVSAFQKCWQLFWGFSQPNVIGTCVHQGIMFATWFWLRCIHIWANKSL